jgi:hypothetical protein
VRWHFFEGGGAPASFGDSGGVLQLEEGTGEVRHGPKGMGNGGTVELNEGGEEWRGDGSLVGRHEHKAVDRDEGGDGVLVEYLRRRMRGGKEKGWATSVTSFISTMGG